MKVIVVGGGCIGLAIAGNLAKDHDVLLHEKKKCGHGASRAAAGMIAPAMEAEYGEIDLLKLALRSRQNYPDFVEYIESNTGMEVGLKEEGTLGVARNDSQAEDLERLFQYQSQLELDVEEITVEEARKKEPRLSSYIRKAVYCSSELQIDNRILVSALKKYCKSNGVDIREQEPVERVHYNRNTIKKISTSEASLNPDLVVLSAGVGSPQIKGLKPEDQLPIRPVKGQALSIALSQKPEVRHVIRSPEVYCVPKDQGHMVVGATMEEKGFDRTVTAGAVLDLLHQSYEMLPFVYENELIETWTGLRPASRDSLPIIGPSSVTDNLIFATGHYRNGILLTPITVELITDWINQREIPTIMEPFLPSRFQEENNDT